MKTVLTCMAVILNFVAGLQAMESKQGQMLQEDKRILTPIEEESVCKMMFLKLAVDEKKLPDIPQDILNVMMGKLHELYLYENPVLNGQLVYTQDSKTMTFKIWDLVKKDGSIDLSNRDIFGDTSDHLLITLDPEMFLHVDENSKRFHILIAPKSLIEAKIETTAVRFKSIMEKWNADIASIGIFYRKECWPDKYSFDHLIHKNISHLSEKNLYDNWRDRLEKSLWFDFPPGLFKYAKNFMFILTEI